MTEIRVFPDPTSLGAAAAEYLLAMLRTEKNSGRYNIALSGGSTPRLMYDYLAGHTEAGELCNERARFFFSDERPVGPDDPQSNYRLASEHLFTPLGISEEVVHRPRGEAPDLEGEASRYEQEIRQYVPSDDAGVPRFDLIFLGMGADGHTASLFPDYPFDTDSDALIVAAYVKT
ncbi:MAG: 6-phosphogluconolactonase, partial [Candidatus Zixiibacteriota bacterium]